MDKKYPDDWKKTTLRDCGNWFSGGTPSKQNIAYWGGDIPWISAKSMHDVFISDSEDKVTLDGANNGTRIVPEQTLLILVRGSMLYKRIPICITTREVTFNQDVKAIVTNSHTLPEFLLYYLMAHENILLSYVTTTGMGAGKLDTDLLEDFYVFLPPLPEQRKIAEILSTWDEAIQLVEALIAALQERKRGLMQRLLTGEVRENWKLSKLGDISEVILSGVDKKSRDDDQKVRLCNYMDVFYNSYITNSMDFMESTASDREIEKCGLQLGDVIITKDSETPEDIAQSAVVVEELNNVICGYHMAILRPVEKEIIGLFLRELIMLPDIHYQFERKANGATRFGITLASLNNIEIPYPSIDDQRTIVEVLQTGDQWIADLQLYTNYLREQKKGLMQRLLTGEVRVKVDQ